MDAQQGRHGVKLRKSNFFFTDFPKIFLNFLILKDFNILLPFRKSSYSSEVQLTGRCRLPVAFQQNFREQARAKKFVNQSCGLLEDAHLNGERPNRWGVECGPLHYIPFYYHSTTTTYHYIAHRLTGETKRSKWINCSPKVARPKRSVMHSSSGQGQTREGREERSVSRRSRNDRTWVPRFVANKTPISHLPGATWTEQ